MRVAHSGTYLGFEIGPSAADTSWSTRIRRFKESLLRWLGHAPGMHLSILAYNTYVFPKLLYVAQLYGSSPAWPPLESSSGSSRAFGGGSRVRWRRRCGMPSVCRARSPA